jgi:hypothetical protein
MDQNRLQELVNLSASAYNAETTGEFLKSYQLHLQAQQAWKALASDTSYFSTKEREHGRMAKIKAELHQERATLLLPYTKEPVTASPDPLPSLPRAKLATTMMLPLAGTVSEEIIQQMRSSQISAVSKCMLLSEEWKFLILVTA